jgi:hypothetical protein
MAVEDKDIEALESQFPLLAQSAFAAARERVFASGQSVVESERGCLCEVFPDGQRILLKIIGPPTFVSVGSKLNIG